MVSDATLMSKRGILRAAASAFILAVLVSTGRARASDGLQLSVDWGKLAKVLNDGASLLPRESLRSTSPLTEPRLFGVSPHLSLVARDWGGSQILIGNLMLTDQLRLSRSCRMIVSRVRLADGRVAPFMQAGLGQWRVDTDLMPAMPRDVQIAAQLGGGFELGLGEHIAIALETDYTVLYREEHGPQMSPGSRPWVTFLAARALF
jgi:hypothetical protein